jgi:hypothetical protein
MNLPLQLSGIIPAVLAKQSVIETKDAGRIEYARVDQRPSCASKTLIFT